jgi:protein-tyrosine phosphatase
MDHCSYFIKDKAIFGSFPTQESVYELENEGVKYFVDLTDNEKEKLITSYITKYTYINYPIKDNYIPTDWIAFAMFILRITKIIRELRSKERLYIHCKGGHGRSGVVVASLLCTIFNLHPTEALEYTTKCHSNRSIMRDKWRKIGSPQTYLQKKFVQKFFEPLKVYHTHKNSILLGFSNLSSHPIELENIGKFDNCELAIKYYINTNGNINIEELNNIFDKKIYQNKNIQRNLLNTGLRPIIYIYTKNNLEDKFDKNIMGKILTNIRKKLYENYTPPHEVHLLS